MSETKVIELLMGIEVMLSESESEIESDDELLVLSELCKFGNSKKRNCIRNYVEEIIPSYTEEEFRRHFRIRKSLFDKICENFQTSEIYKSLRADKRFTPQKHMAVFLWFAGHEACSFRDLADRFDISLSSVCRIVNRVTMFLSKLSPQVIKWPNDVEKLESANFFRNKARIPKAIGCIDGTHIVIDPPDKSKDDYIDRKGLTSICLQGICNEKKKFISIFVGYPGSSHDSWVFHNSPIYKKLPEIDSAYPCTKHLVTPYRDNGHLTSAQKDFNMKLSSCRVTIEHTFGILKQRFRQLYYCKLRGIEKLCHFIRACCVLHNIANEDDFDFNDEPTPPEPTLNDDTMHYRGSSKGNFIRDTIYQEMETFGS